MQAALPDALHASDELLRSLFRASLDGIVVLDLQGRIVDVNDAYCRTIGYARDELLRMGIGEIDASENEAETAARIARIVATGGDRFETRHRRKDGTIFEAEVSVSLHPGDGGRLVVFQRDVTERKRAERALEQSESRFRALVQATSDCIWECDAEGRFTYLSPNFEKILGEPAEAFLGRSPADLPVADGTAMIPPPHRAALSERAPVEGLEYRMRHRDGHMVEVEVSAVPVFAPSGEFKGMRGVTRNVTKRNEANRAREEALRETTAELATVLDNTSVGITLLRDRRVVWANSRLAELLGYRPEEMTGLSSRVVFLDDASFDTVGREDYPLLSQGKTTWREMELVRRDGTRFWARISAKLVDCSRPEVGAICVLDDISARKRVEQSNARLLQALDESTEFVGIATLGGSVLYVNAGGRRLIGMDRGADVTTLTIADFHPAWAMEKFTRDARPVLAAGGRWQGELALCGPEGSEIPVAATIFPLRDERGEMTALATVQTDLTDVKRREAALRMERRRLDDILAGTRAGTWEWNVQTGALVLNERSYEIIGRTPQEFAPLTLAKWQAILHPGDLAHIHAWMEQHAHDETAYLDVELRERHKAGHWVWVLTRGKVVSRTEDGKPLLISGTHLDISASKNAEAALAQARDVAEVANQAKSAFLAHMSHEIRTPMNAVINFAQLLQEEPLTAEQSELVGTINEAGQALLRIIDDILDFSKIEAGQLQIERQPLDVAGLLNRVESLLQGAAAAKGLRLAIASPHGRLRPLLGDTLRLEQVLVNLINNAIKFTSQGGITLNVCTQGETANCTRLRFEVRDTGIGIGPETIATLFTPFTQADSGVSRRFGGTGLGLSICKRLVEMMGGEIGVTSELGQGSTFWFEIPFIWAEAQDRAPAPAKPTEAAGPQLAGLRVLAADDNQVNLLIVDKILKSQGAATVFAADGQQALQILQANPQGFDVVLMDIQMPVMDGLTATRAIRANPALAHLPVIALTAGVLEAERDKAKAAGVDDFLAKPLDPKRMISMLAAIQAGRPRG